MFQLAADAEGVLLSFGRVVGVRGSLSATRTWLRRAVDLRREEEDDVFPPDYNVNQYVGWAGSFVLLGW
jgi:hypothetical protein